MRVEGTAAEIQHLAPKRTGECAEQIRTIVETMGDRAATVGTQYIMTKALLEESSA